MLCRKIYQKLVEWKNCKKKECLVLKGARQVGKTTTIREFGRKEYESLIEMNFLEHPEQKAIFAGALSSERILQNITLYLKEAKIIPHKTLLFLDEIQACGNARTALKFLAEAGTVDVIASGSLLGLVYNEEKSGNPISIPVGYETTFMMYSLDFEEFLWALGYSGLDTLKDYAREPKPLEKSLFVHYQDLFRQYLIVGGMPEVVFSFAKIMTSRRYRLCKTKSLHPRGKILSFMPKESKRSRFASALKVSLFSWPERTRNSSMPMWRRRGRQESSAIASSGLSTATLP